MKSIVPVEMPGTESLLLNLNLILPTSQGKM